MRKPKLPKKEVEICERLRFAREHVLDITQAGCAGQIGLDRSTLANYETARTPLRYEVALRFCRQFIISEEWLATGGCDACHKAAAAHGIDCTKNWEYLNGTIFIRQTVDLLSDPAATQLRPGMLYSAAFKLLEARYAQLVLEFFYSPRIALSDADNEMLPVNLLEAVHKRHFLLLDNEAARLQYEQHLDVKDVFLRRLYTRCLFECSNLIYRKIMGKSIPAEYLEDLNWLKTIVTNPDATLGPQHVAKKPASEIRVGEPSNPKVIDSQVSLDTPAATVDSSAMQALKSVPDLVARLKKLSKKFGSNAALARKLDVSRQAVDQWLNGKTTPSTDIAIKVMNLDG